MLSLVGRKLDMVGEYEDRVPAFVEQMFDRLEASGIIVGWGRDDWEIGTTSIGLDIGIGPRETKSRRGSERRRERSPGGRCLASERLDARGGRPGRRCSDSP